MDGTSALSALSSVVTSTLKVAEKVIEIYAVDEEARALLQTVDQVSLQLRHARTLRRQKSSLFTNFEKGLFDDTFNNTDKALLNVARLAEGARADMEVSGGQVRLQTRIIFVLRNSPRILVNLTQLGIASQSLSTHLATLCSRQERYAARVTHDPATASLEGEVRPPPPSYEETLFLNEGRQRNLRKRASALASASISSFCSSTTSSSRGPETVVETATMATGDVSSDSTAPTVGSYTDDGPGELLHVASTRRRGREARNRWMEERCK